MEWPVSSCTRKRASGKSSVTRPSNVISSSFAIRPPYKIFSRKATAPMRSDGSKHSWAGGLRPAKPGSGLLQIRRGVLAAAPVGLDVEADLLALDESHHAGPLQRRRMDEHVLAAVVRLDEAIALLAVVEFHRTRLHGFAFRLSLHIRPVARIAPSGSVDFWGDSLNVRPQMRRRSQVVRPKSIFR